MKSSVWDFVLAGAWTTMLLLLAGASVWWLTPWLRAAFGDYHVLAGAALFFLIFGLLCGASVRLLMRVRPFAPGKYSPGSPEFSRWMLVTVLYHLGRGALRPLAPFYMQPLVDASQGARIGGGAAFGGAIDDPYFVSIGNHVVLGHNSLVTGSYMWEGKVVCGPVKIGDEVTVGANAIVLPNTEIGAGACVSPGSVVLPGTVIPPGEEWKGHPARMWKPAKDAVPRPGTGPEA